MIGFDIVEVSPPFDHAEITSIAAATILHDWICVKALQKS
jgi:agmatinase